MFKNMNNNDFINLAEIGNDLKEIFDKIFRKISKNKQENCVEDLIVKYGADVNFLDKLSMINNLMNSLSDKLESLDSFENEFHNFLSIQNMISYIIEDIKRFILYSSFAHDLATSFCNLIDNKIKSFQKNDEEQYKQVYNSFDENLFNKEEYFYKNIFEGSHQYDDLIDEVTNILW